jgi:hypothetical protein
MNYRSEQLELSRRKFSNSREQARAMLRRLDLDPNSQLDLPVNDAAALKSFVGGTNYGNEHRIWRGGGGFPNRRLAERPYVTYPRHLFTSAEDLIH